MRNFFNSADGRRFYDQNTLVARMQLVARLIQSGFGTRIFYVKLDGFDTHSAQAQAHEKLLGEVADAILAAGYRKPWRITTLEELDALPFESVIRDGDECVLERWGDPDESGWVTVMVTSFVPRDQITLPVTVLHIGAAK
jgi:hypothetical protein